ncbi:hypothetical protein ACSSS7_001347 [Eimeria intestinalis]
MLPAMLSLLLPPAMPCEKCEAKLTRLVTPDVKEGSKRVVGVNKLIEKTTKKDKVVIVGSKCKVCKSSLHMKGKYCAPCSARAHHLKDDPAPLYTETALKLESPLVQVRSSSSNSRAAAAAAAAAAIAAGISEIAVPQPNTAAAGAATVLQQEQQQQQQRQPDQTAAAARAAAAAAAAATAAAANWLQCRIVRTRIVCRWRSRSSSTPRSSSSGRSDSSSSSSSKSYSSSSSKCCPIGTTRRRQLKQQGDCQAAADRSGARQREGEDGNQLSLSLAPQSLHVAAGPTLPDAAAAAAAVAGIGPPRSQWRELMRPGAPSPRESNCAVVLNSKMYVFGGYSGMQWLNDLYAFDLEKEEWEEIPHWGMKPCPRFGFVAAADESRECILLFGGYDGRLWGLNLISQHALFLFGGYNGVERLSDLFRFDLNTEVWSLITTFSGPRRGAPQPGQFCCWEEAPPVSAASADAADAADAATAGSAAADSDDVGAAAAAAGAARRDPDGAAAAAAAAAAAIQPLQQRRGSTTSGGGNSSTGINSSTSSSSSSSSSSYRPFNYLSSARCSKCGTLSSSSSSSSSSKCLPPGPVARYFHSACAKDGKLFVFGGYSGRERLNDFHELNLGQNP